MNTPASVTGGTGFSFTITALDAFNNAATGYSGTVHVTSSDGQATLPADYTFVPADAGSHTFSATLRTLGAQSLTATDTVNSSVTGTQTGIQRFNCLATHMAFTLEPVNTTAGQTFSVQVSLLISSTTSQSTTARAR